MPISYEDMSRSYRHMLLARIQEREFALWGGDIVQSCQRSIADHKTLEDAFILEEMERRRASAAAFKEALDKK